LNFPLRLLGLFSTSASFILHKSISEKYPNLETACRAHGHDSQGHDRTTKLRIDETRPALYLYSSRFRRHVKPKEHSDEFTEYFFMPSLERAKWLVQKDSRALQFQSGIIKPTSVKARFIWWLTLIASKLNSINILYPDRLVASKYKPLEALDYIGTGEVGRLNYKMLHVPIVYVGAPGPFQKITLQVSDANFRVREYFKIGFTSEAKQRIQSEAESLRILEKFSHESFEIPSLVALLNGVGADNGTGIVIKNILTSVDRTSMELLDQDFQFVTALMSSQPTVTIKVAEFLSENEANFLASRLPEKLLEKSIKLYPAHGDYSPWNRFLSNEKVKVIDWETYGYFPALADLFIFVIQISVLVDSETWQRVLALCEDVFNHDMIKMIVDTIDHEFLPSTFYLYLLMTIVTIRRHYVNGEGQGDTRMESVLSSLVEELVDRIRGSDELLYRTIQSSVICRTSLSVRNNYRSSNSSR